MASAPDSSISIAISSQPWGPPPTSTNNVVVASTAPATSAAAPASASASAAPPAAHPAPPLKTPTIPLAVDHSADWNASLAASSTPAASSALAGLPPTGLTPRFSPVAGLVSPGVSGEIAANIPDSSIPSTSVMDLFRSPYYSFNPSGITPSPPAPPSAPVNPPTPAPPVSAPQPAQQPPAAPQQQQQPQQQQPQQQPQQQQQQPQQQQQQQQPQQTHHAVQPPHQAKQPAQPPQPQQPAVSAAPATSAAVASYRAAPTLPLPTAPMAPPPPATQSFLPQPPPLALPGSAASAGMIGLQGPMQPAAQQPQPGMGRPTLPPPEPQHPPTYGGGGGGPMMPGYALQNGVPNGVMPQPGATSGHRSVLGSGIVSSAVQEAQARARQKAETFARDRKRKRVVEPTPERKEQRPVEEDSKLSPEERKKQRYQRRLALNRESAAVSRVRRREYVKLLEEQLVNAENERVKLAKELEKMEKQHSSLQTKLKKLETTVTDAPAS